MKHLLKSIHPKRLFSSNKLSKSPTSSFASTVSSSSSSSSSSSTSSTTFKFDVVSAFHLLDRNSDGKIDTHELKPVFNNSISDKELSAMIEEIDVDGDGCISLDELQAVGSLFESTAHEEEAELRAAFDFFDSDHDGKISALELFQGFMNLGDQRCTLDDCRRMIESVDVNQDGFVCFQDFSRMMDVIPR